uniref:(northern house mosquito) hypothetical protein n=1 Tax=Culex pipiens TaxID=7175 RepID=A0A8D8FBX7_CULPI
MDNVPYSIRFCLTIQNLPHSPDRLNPKQSILGRAHPPHTFHKLHHKQLILIDRQALLGHRPFRGKIRLQKAQLFLDATRMEIFSVPQVALESVSQFEPLSEAFQGGCCLSHALRHRFPRVGFRVTIGTIVQAGITPNQVYQLPRSPVCVHPVRNAVLQERNQEPKVPLDSPRPKPVALSQEDVVTVPELFPPAFALCSAGGTGRIGLPQLLRYLLPQGRS